MVETIEPSSIRIKPEEPTPPTNPVGASSGSRGTLPAVDLAAMASSYQVQPDLDTQVYLPLQEKKPDLYQSSIIDLIHQNDKKELSIIKNIESEYILSKQIKSIITIDEFIHYKPLR